MASACNLDPVDASCVRKLKLKSDGTIVLKHRLCARGFLDSQVRHLTARATTTTKLNQKLLLAISQIDGHELESWDVSGAFLEVFPKEKLRNV